MNGLLEGGALGFVVAAVFSSLMHSDSKVYALSMCLLAIAMSILAVGSAL